jgi:hypothetical protein
MNYPAVGVWQRLSVEGVAPIGAAKAELVFSWAPYVDPVVAVSVDAVSLKQRS